MLFLCQGDGVLEAPRPDLIKVEKKMNKKERIEECLCEIETIGYVLHGQVKIRNPHRVYGLLRDLKIALELEIERLKK